MALVLLCGHPCSGKSTVARHVAASLSPTAHVAVIDEASLAAAGKLCYADMGQEKNLRGVLRSAVDRSVGRDRVVLVDSLNSIKGYRYELWCLARAAGTLYCVIYCDVSIETARAWNAEREAKGGAAYPPPILEDLLRRFEAPQKRNRWDSPLFELRPGQDSEERVAEVVAEVVKFVSSEGGEGGGGRGPRNLQPTMATQNPKLSETNRLYEMDRATQEVINNLMEAQAAAGGAPAGDVQIGNSLPLVHMNRCVGLPQLRRLRKTFLKLASHSSLTNAPPPSDSLSAKRMFADYLNQEIALDT